MYRVTDQFTTRDGRVHPTGEQYGITNEAAEKWRAELGDKGCATCIFVRVIGGPATEVFFKTVAGYTEKHPIVNGWAHMTMYNPGSGYNPENNVGPWQVFVEGYPSEVVEGIGLPYGWHVSKFVVFEYEEGDVGDGPDEPDGPLPAEELYVEVVVDHVRYSGKLKKL